MRLVVLLIGLGISSLDVRAQQVTELVPFTKDWRYHNLRTDLGTAWRARAYVDTTWASGAALLGLEDSVVAYAPHGLTINTIDIGPTPGRTPTIYFRTHFTSPVAGTTPGVSLIMSNLVDDGCVIYLNGTEAGRVRVAANQTYASFATGAGTEGALETVVINPALLTAGDNVLAVEVHNAATDSSDLVFGARVMLLRDSALSITSQPQDEAVFAGDTATFTVGVSGGPATYRWFRGTTLLTSTSNTLNIANAQVANAGTNYFVVVSNAANVVTSRLATLRIVTDTEGPQMLRAVIANTPCGGGAAFSTNSINIVFASRDGRDPCTDAVPQEPLNANSARIIENYRLVSSTNPNIQIPILSVLYSSALGVLLNVDGTNANWNPTGSYYLIVNNIADDRGNNINPNTVIGVSILVTTNLTQMSDAWSFYDFNLFDPNGVDIYTDTTNPWYGTNYNTVTNYGWGSGRGIFDTQNPGRPNVTCESDTVAQTVSYNVSATGVDVPTLFRRTFTVPGGLPANGNFRLRYAVDDGMVVYLNGIEIHRFNMPAGPITYLSQALTQVGTTVPCTTNVTVPVSGLRPGTNVLAAAVFQVAAIGENDTTFGLEMDLVSIQLRQGPTNRCLPAPRLAYTRSRTNFVLSWPATNYGYALQYSTNITSVGPLGTHGLNWWTTPANWTQVADQSNPYTNRIPPTTGPRRFYRLFRESCN